MFVIFFGGGMNFNDNVIMLFETFGCGGRTVQSSVFWSLRFCVVRFSIKFSIYFAISVISWYHD